MPRCVYCHKYMPKGTIMRIWDGKPFCDQYHQASYMLKQGKAFWRPARSDCRSYYDHYILKGKPIIEHRKLRFTDFDEFVQYLVEEYVGIIEIAGERVEAL